MSGTQTSSSTPITLWFHVTPTKNRRIDEDLVQGRGFLTGVREYLLMGS